MDNNEKVLEKTVSENDIKNIIKEQLNVTEVKDTDRLIDDLYADSLDVVEILMNIEDTYGVEISENEINGNCKVEEIVDLVLHKIND